MAKEYRLQGYYSDSNGWETLITLDSRADAERLLKEYDENEVNYPHRIVERA